MTCGTGLCYRSQELDLLDGRTGSNLLEPTGPSATTSGHDDLKSVTAAAALSPPKSLQILLPAS